ncbi:unnamed protein product [Penicillium camemberti]|uniref:Str. FM013 n=1 Tax=Penicillium camemberti (strain FM 013) TaxID=1429867 RepID=A0A0G4PY36_PENC3|nr:unnamed protein product [Penicillium camemberti]
MLVPGNADRYLLSQSRAVECKGLTYRIVFSIVNPPPQFRESTAPTPTPTPTPPPSSHESSTSSFTIATWAVGFFVTLARPFIDHCTKKFVRWLRTKEGAPAWVKSFIKKEEAPVKILLQEVRQAVEELNRSLNKPAPGIEEQLARLEARQAAAENVVKEMGPLVQLLARLVLEE